MKSLAALRVCFFAATAVNALGLSATAADPAAPQSPLRMNAHFIAGPAAGQDRAVWLAALQEYRTQARSKLDLHIYDRADLEWMRGAFTCHFTFMYDRAFYNPERNEYTVAALLEDGRDTFGGYDAVVLWQGYPRLGFDPRNQFDMYRDMPGGLQRLREVVQQFHDAGVQVFIDYNPWDTGTRREALSDDEALAELVKTIAADGIFLDTMAVAPVGLRQTIDLARPGVAFVPEVHPDQPQLALCSGSWAQWLDDPAPPGMLHLKWVEPRHMQYQIGRWDRSHAAEIRTAFFNGSGIMIWENVFGSYNPWSADEAAQWRRAARILHCFAENFAGDEWDPFYPTSSPKLAAHRWPGKDATVFTLRGNSSKPDGESSFIEVPVDKGDAFFNLWNGRAIEPRRVGDHYRIEVVLKDGLGCIACIHGSAMQAKVRKLLASQREDAAEAGNPMRGALKPTVYSESVTRTQPIAADAAPAGMVFVRGGDFLMRIKHQRRECGCYLDPSMKAALGQDLRWGSPFDEIIQHAIQTNVKGFFIDEAEVTNADYKQFLDATGYRPRFAENFLAHWQDGHIPAGLEDHPVVYVDSDDARAYANWAGKRLPSEAEWQLAAQGPQGRTWPWGEEFEAARCNMSNMHTSPVRLMKEGRSASGCYGMADNVSELTAGEYDDGHTRFVMLRGGSFYATKGSDWYVSGGPQPCDTHAKFIRMWPGLDRCATVGFRCVQDVTE